MLVPKHTPGLWVRGHILLIPVPTRENRSINVLETEPNSEWPPGSPESKMERDKNDV